MKGPRPYWRAPRSEQQLEPKPDFIQKFLLTPALVLALATAILYFQGQAFYSGYLSYWGLNSQVFPLSFEDTLTNGAWGYILLGIDKWRYLAGLGSYFLLMYALLFLLLFPKPRKAILRILKTKRINEGQKALVSEASDRFSMISLVLSILLLLILTSLLSIKKGEALAAANHQKIKDTKEMGKPFKTVTINYLGEQGQAVAVTGALIQSSSTMFALNTDGDDLLLIPATRLVSIRYHGTGNAKAAN